jgi:septal ring factor EnvC (AmiA/AmiB activator)
MSGEPSTERAEEDDEDLEWGNKNRGVRERPREIPKQDSQRVSPEKRDCAVHAIRRDDTTALQRRLQRVEKENEHFRSEIARISREKEGLKDQVQTIDAELAALHGKLELSARQSSEREALLRQENRKLKHSADAQKSRIADLERLLESGRDSLTARNAGCEHLRSELERPIGKFTRTARSRRRSQI